MFILAEAKFGLALAGDTPGDKPKLQDAALAYLRVVAHFSELPGNPRAALSLSKAAAVCEQLGDKAGAIQLYREVADRFKDDPQLAAAAGRAIERLKAE